METNNVRMRSGVQILPGSHFLILGMVKIDGASPQPIEIDLGETLNLAPHTICVAPLKDAIRAAVKRAMEVGHYRRVKTAPSREVGPGEIVLTKP